MKISRANVAFFIAMVLAEFGGPAARAQAQQERRGIFAEPSDAPQVRAQMTQVEKLLPTLADRGAALYFLAVSKEHLGESVDALKLRKECIDLEEGFEST